jgi:hypothetical protein
MKAAILFLGLPCAVLAQTTVNGSRIFVGRATFSGGASLSTQPLTATYPNENATGTSQNKLAKLAGSPSAAVLASTTDTSGVVGVCVSGCGTTSNAEIANRGQVICIFDGATNSGDYVQISSTVTGNCHDAGATYPVLGQVLGRVLSTNGTGGTYAMQLFGPEIQASAGGGIGGSGTANRVPLFSTGTTLGNSSLSQDAATGQISAGKTINGPSPAAGTFSATPIIDLALCQRCEMPTLTANVTSVTFTHAKPGLAVSVVWSQDGTGGRAVTYGGSATNMCGVFPAANSVTVQRIEIASDGATPKGVGCAVEGPPNVVAFGSTGSALATPASSKLACWLDAMDNELECKDSSGNVKRLVQSVDCTGTGHLLKINADGSATCSADAGGGGAVNSVFGRTGVVTAQNGDYSATQVTNAMDATLANTVTNVTAPGTPVAGKAAVYVDSATKVWSAKDDAGNVTHGYRTTDCSGVGHVQKLNADGTVMCSADASGPGGGSGNIWYLGQGHLGNQIYSGGSSYVPLMGATGTGTNEGLYQYLAPAAGTLSNFSINATAPTTGGVSTCTVRVNATNTPISVSFTAGAGTTTQTDSTHTLAVNPLDHIAVLCANNGSNAMTVLSSALQLAGSASGVSSVFGRTGTVTAQPGDYTAAQVTNAFDTNAANVITNVIAPPTPAVGKTALYVDSTNKLWSAKDEAGNVTHGVRTADCSGTGHLQKINADGSVTCSADAGGGGMGVGRTTLSATWSAIPDGTCQEQTAAWTGITMADSVVLGLPAGLNNGLLANGRVSAVDTVAIRLCNLSGAAVNPGTQNFKATLAVYNLMGNGVIDFPPIADGTCVAQTFALSGVSANDPLSAKWPATLEPGLIGTMSATTQDTIQVRLCNLSGAAVDPASQSFGTSVAK